MTGTFLDRILEKRRLRLAEAKRRFSPAALREAAETARSALPFTPRGRPPYIIAEIKKASPSKGVLRTDFDPVQFALSYEKVGATAISVLTEEDFFQGSLDHLRSIRAVSGLPLLRKDFLFDAYQIYEARAAGADLFLLILAMLDDATAHDLKVLGEELGMTALIEVHDAAEAERALRLGVRLLGINNRNLRTFETHLETTLALLPQLPRSVRVVTESGFQTRADIERLLDAGVDTFLIGEAFMRAAHPGQALMQLLGSSASHSKM